MSNKKDIVDISSESKALIQRYVKNRMDAYKLDFAENITKINTRIISFFVFTFISLLVFTFLSLAGGWQIGIWLDSMPLGFLIMAIFWMLFFLVILAMRKQLIELPMLRWIIRILFQPKK